MLGFVITAIILNTIYIINLSKNKYKQYGFRVVIVSFVPLVGLVMVLFIDYYTKVTSQSAENGNHIIKSIDKNFQKVEKNEKSAPNMRQQKSTSDIISVEEALLINSDDIKRKLIIETIKGDAFKYLSFLKKALNDPDTETSHYAATAVSEIKRKMTIAIQEMAVKYKENRDDVLVISSYVNFLKKYVDSGLLDDRNKVKYYVEISKLLVELIGLKPLKEYYEEKINIDLILNDFTSAKSYCDMFIEQYGDCEESYLMMMKYYYKKNDFINFNSILENLKESDARFSENSIRMVRFWDHKNYTY